MNPKNSKKSPIHENADANITCDFGDGDISRSMSFLSNTCDTYIHTHIASSIIGRWFLLLTTCVLRVHVGDKSQYIELRDTYTPLVTVSRDEHKRWMTFLVFGRVFCIDELDTLMYNAFIVTVRDLDC